MSDCALLTPLCRSLQSPPKTLELYEFNPGTRRLGFSRAVLKPRSCSNGMAGKIHHGDFSNSLNSDFSGQAATFGGAFEQSNVVNSNCGLNSRRSGNDMFGKLGRRGFAKLLNLGRRDRFGGCFVENGGQRHRHKLNSCVFGLDNYSERCKWKVRSSPNDTLAKVNHRDYSRSLSFCNLDSFSEKSDRIQSVRGGREGPVLNCVKRNWNYGSREILDENFEFEQYSRGGAEDACLDPTMALDTEEKILSAKLAINGLEFGNGRKTNNPNSDSSLSSTLDLLELKGESEKAEEIMSSGTQEDSDLIPAEGSEKSAMAYEGGDFVERPGSRRKHMLRRSAMLAKQVISMQSAFSLGFVSQLWVDTRSWVVLLVEVRPSLLSGEMERFLLEDVCQVGDVVLVQDESVMENEFKMIGLDTLVGYNVITPGRHNVGKVRGYTFDMSSGAVELLELDPFGISIIPASLVSTYGLPADDVLEVTSDTVVVHEDAVSRIQKLSKGFWDTRNLEFCGDEPRGYSNLNRQPIRSVRHRRSRNYTDDKKFSRKMRDTDVDWELPMDY